jgi:hypothetical protein
LQRYETAIAIYRQVGARLGEANTLCGLGSLRDDPGQALQDFLAAQAIYVQIGDQYSQGRNLLMYIVQAQAQVGDGEGVLRSLDEATAIGEAIGFEPFCQVAAELRSQLL